MKKKDIDNYYDLLFALKEEWLGISPAIIKKELKLKTDNIIIDNIILSIDKVIINGVYQKRKMFQGFNYVIEQDNDIEEPCE